MRPPCPQLHDVAAAGTLGALELVERAYLGFQMPTPQRAAASPAPSEGSAAAHDTDPLGIKGNDRQLVNVNNSLRHCASLLFSLRSRDASDAKALPLVKRHRVANTDDCGGVRR